MTTFNIEEQTPVATAHEWLEAKHQVKVMEDEVAHFKARADEAWRKLASIERQLIDACPKTTIIDMVDGHVLVSRHVAGNFGKYGVVEFIE